VEPDGESLVVTSSGACRLSPGGKADSSATPEELELDPELESDRSSWAAAGPVEVPVRSFVLREVSVLESVGASEGAAPEASSGAADESVAVGPSVMSVVPASGAHA
jgi:hypothetical protein